MKKILVKILTLVIAFIMGWILSYYLQEPKIVTIHEKPIESNIIKKDPYKIPYTEAMEDLKCFYSGIPTLELKYLENDEYEQTASLCARQWKRKTNIEVLSKQYHNMIISGAFFNSEKKLGFKVEYYRFYGRFGFGGGLAFAQCYGQIDGGVAWRF